MPMPADEVMPPKRSRWISVLAAILMLLFICTITLALRYGLRSPVDPVGAHDVVAGLSLIAFPAVGWLIAIRHPQNPLGWIFLTSPIAIGIGSLGEIFAPQAAHVDSDTLAAILVIVGRWLSFFGYWLLIGLGLVLFPDGRFPGIHFRWASWGIAALILIYGVTSAIGFEIVCVDLYPDSSTECIQSVDNPLAISWGAGLGEAAEILLIALSGLLLAVSLTAIFVRYRRSTREVQQQIKWIAWLATVGLLSLTILFVSQDVLGLITSEWPVVISSGLIIVGMPVGIGVAILKYRLYDIDRIISRTAAYTVVVGVLAAIYAIGVTLMQRILPVEGQFGVVASTLIVAALFNPLRRRVQRAVDHRFNRSRYDARQVLDAFSTQLQDNVHLEQIQAALLNTTQETLQPSHLSLWVRELEPE